MSIFIFIISVATLLSEVMTLRLFLYQINEKLKLCYKIYQIFKLSLRK